MTGADVGGTSSGWDESQCREFARQLARTHRASWHAYVADVRRALIDSFVLAVVLGQRTPDVQVADVKAMRDRVGMHLATRHAMPNPIADARAA